MKLTRELATVEVITQHGKEQRLLVEVLRDTFYVCSEAEWLAAEADGRPPRLCGFNKRFVNQQFGKVGE